MSTQHRTRTRHSHALARTAAVITAVLFFVLLARLSVEGRISILVYYGALAVNLVGFLLYWHDKRAAEAQQWRVPEAQLHLVALCGGWPGALIARYHFRHKTKKLSFRIIYWITALTNCGAMVWWLYPGAIR